MDERTSADAAVAEIYNYITTDLCFPSVVYVCIGVLHVIIQSQDMNTLYVVFDYTNV